MKLLQWIALNNSNKAFTVFTARLQSTRGLVITFWVTITCSVGPTVWRREEGGERGGTTVWRRREEGRGVVPPCGGGGRRGEGWYHRVEEEEEGEGEVVQHL